MNETTEVKNVPNYPQSPCYGPSIAKAIHNSDPLAVYATEALMRGDVGTLDGLSAQAFKSLAWDCFGDLIEGAKTIGPDFARDVARSHGFKV